MILNAIKTLLITSIGFGGATSVFANEDGRLLIDLIKKTGGLEREFKFSFDKTLKTEGGDINDPETNGKERTLRSLNIYFRDGKVGGIDVILTGNIPYYCSIKKGDSLWSKPIFKGEEIAFSSGIFNPNLNYVVMFLGQTTDGTRIVLSCSNADRDPTLEGITKMNVKDLFETLYSN